MLKASIIALALALESVAFGQHDGRCGAEWLTERFMQENRITTDLLTAFAGMKDNTGGDSTLTIPVVVHVIWNVPSENVPSSAIIAMVNAMDQDLQQLNSDQAGVREDFVPSIGDPGIRVCLAQIDPQGESTTGITRTFTTATWFDPNTQADAMKSPLLGISAWDPTRYLNIWICDISSGATGGSTMQGYAYLPVPGMPGSPTDGLVIDPVHGLPVTSRTATHEIGHYLGLLHPWAGGGCESDDGFDDTPDTDSPTPSCANPNLHKCGVLTQYENFMEYSNCMAMFTHEQAAYMRSIMFGVRSSLLSSNGCGLVDPSSIGDNDLDHVLLYPNPTAGSVTLSMGKVGPATIILHDLQGRVLWSLNTTRDETVIPLEDLSDGLYLVTLAAESGHTRTLHVLKSGL